MTVRKGVILGNSSHTGRVRIQNEDYFGYAEPEDEDAFAAKGRLTIVADGMGGEAGGFTASRIAVDRIIEHYLEYSGDEPRAALRSAIEVANQAIHDRGNDDPNCRGMGTTATCAVIKGREVFLGHVGDSRAYLIRDGKLRQLSEDHTLVAKMVRAGTLTEEQARDHPNANVITRALGRDRDVQIDVTGPEALLDGDVLLLCSDGLHGLVEDAELAAITSRLAPQRICETLVDLANQRGGHDNITVQVVFIGDELPESLADDQAAADAVRAAIAAASGTCPTCRASVPPEAQFCDACGASLGAGGGRELGRPRKRSLVLRAIITLLMLALIATAVFVAFRS